MFIIPDRGWKFTTYFFSFLMFLFLFRSCEKSSLPVISGQVRLVPEEVGVTEAWLRVQTEKMSGEFSLTLWRDDTCIFQGIFRQADTTLYDSTLLPAHRYIYRASLKRGGHPVLDSAPLEITTMDTTSHDFQWEIIEFSSPYGSGALYDVAIIDENDPSGGASRTGIWAVGEIYSDSAKPWLPYNAVHLSVGQAGWDGQSWELKQIPFIGSCSAVDYPPIRAIWAFSENNILFTNGGAIVRYNGSSFYLDCGMNPLLEGAINKIFAINPSNVYAVGGVGTITHYDGQSWQRIESGTELPIQDIWGAKNEKSGEYEILCIASDKYHNLGKKILGIKEGNTYSIQDAGLSWSLSSVWFVPNRQYYIAGAGIYHKRNIYSPTPWVRYSSGTVTNYFTNRIRGNGINDVVAAGAFGEIVHFNGITWQNYFSEIQLMPGALYGLDMKNQVIVAVGEHGRNAVVAIGIR